MSLFNEDIIVATGYSDYPNQISNVIAFAYIFRGALDTRARSINDDRKWRPRGRSPGWRRNRDGGAGMAHGPTRDLGFGRDDPDDDHQMTQERLPRS